VNFALGMLALLVLTGGVALADRLVLRRSRPADAREPWWIEYPKSFFPVILVVFVLRSFLVEPFKIPSGSMIPTLLVGDFILVNKFVYGIRMPVTNTKLIDVSSPKHGDVMVFRFPGDPSQDYIKRVIGLPGDTVEYRNKRLTVNGKPIPVEPEQDFNYVESGNLNLISSKRFRETAGEHRHSIIVNLDAPSVQLASVQGFPQRERCEYNDEGFVCRVPEGQYFMMGDNRDSSHDSRYWGFVPDANVVGRAFAIWWNFGALGRIGSGID
jgi:signal peptidase I